MGSVMVNLIPIDPICSFHEGLWNEQDIHIPQKNLIGLDGIHKEKWLKISLLTINIKPSSCIFESIFILTF
jgi:hypothetical protein